MLRIIYIFVFVFTSGFSIACQCPVTTLSLNECNKYEIIFKGRIDSVKPCENNLGEAFFRIDELYKGNVTQYFKVLFRCDEPCAVQFNKGEEWIIYTRYKQVNNAMMDWCSRSRKYFKVENQDFYKVNYGNDYEEEAAFLRKNLGLHRVASESKNVAEQRNIKPNITQTIVILIISLTAIVLFYWLFNKFFKF